MKPLLIFWLTGSFVTIATDINSLDTVSFIQIVESNCVGDGVLHDDYSHKIAAGVNYLNAHNPKDHILQPFGNQGFILKKTDFIMQRTIISVTCKLYFVFVIH